jgi:hypothetical protein
MLKLYGIVPAPDGTFVQTTLIKEQTCWKVSQVKRWGIQDTFKNLLLMNRNVFLGVETHWLHKQIPENVNISTAASLNSDFIACTQSVHYELYRDELANNICGIFPDDAYLCAVPLYMIASPVDDFVSIVQEEQFYKIAIVIKRQLKVVFSVNASDSYQLKGYFNRIRRFWKNQDASTPFPEITVAININDIVSDGIRDVKTILLEEKDTQVLKAAGIALCGLEPIAPAYSGPTEACKFKSIRAALYGVSALLIAAAVMVFVVYGSLNVFYLFKVNKCKAEYTNIISHNNEISDLLKVGGVLADKVSRIESVGAQQTSWAKLLQFIGNEHPQSLYIEKLGSEPMKNNADMKIVLMGWAVNESLVTELLKKMNSLSIIKNTTLANLERDDKNNNLCKFKILCQLKM